MWRSTCLLACLACAAWAEPSRALDADRHSCPPTVRLEGPAEMVTAVAAELKVHGIAVDDGLVCMTVLARLRPGAPGFELKIADTQGRTVTRQVTDAPTAAAVIESWARTDLVGPMLDDWEGRTPPALAPPPALPAGGSLAAAAGAPPTPAAAAPRIPEQTLAFSAGVWLGGALASGNTRWGDVALSGSLGVGPLCLGGLLRAGLDFGEHGASMRLDTDRSSLDVLLGVELPVTIGRWWLLLPGFSLGPSLTQSTVDGDDAPLPGGPVRRTDPSLHMAATSKLGLRVREHLYLAALLGFELVPLGRTNVDANDLGVQVAGIPRWFARAALGLHYQSY